VSAEIRHLGGALARPQAGQGSLGTLDCQFMTFGDGALASIGCAPSRRRTTRATCFAPTTDPARLVLNT
jgi:hypothetical protein